MNISKISFQGSLSNAAIRNDVLRADGNSYKKNDEVVLVTKYAEDDNIYTPAKILDYYANTQNCITVTYKNLSDNSIKNTISTRNYEILNENEAAKVIEAKTDDLKSLKKVSNFVF